MRLGGYSGRLILLTVLCSFIFVGCYWTRYSYVAQPTLVSDEYFRLGAEIFPASGLGEGADTAFGIHFWFNAPEGWNYPEPCNWPYEKPLLPRVENVSVVVGDSVQQLHPVTQDRRTEATKVFCFLQETFKVFVVPVPRPDTVVVSLDMVVEDTLQKLEIKRRHIELRGVLGSERKNWVKDWITD